MQSLNLKKYIMFINIYMNKNVACNQNKHLLIILSFKC